MREGICPGLLYCYHEQQILVLKMIEQNQKRKWVKILMQHLHREKPTPSEIKALIKWSENTNIEIKQYKKIIKDTSWTTSNTLNN